MSNEVLNNGKTVLKALKINDSTIVFEYTYTLLYVSNVMQVQGMQLEAYPFKYSHLSGAI